MSKIKNILPLPRGLDEPRYRDSPIYLFFEDYVVAVLGELPQSDFDKLEAMDLQTIFDTEATSWPAVVAEVLHLSDTIEVAILDLWNRNRTKLLDQGQRYHPLAFAQDFTDHYMAEDSQVDVWTPESLSAATARVEPQLSAARRLTRDCS